MVDTNPMTVDKSRWCSATPESDAMRICMDLTLGSVESWASIGMNKYSPHRSVCSSPCHQRRDEVAAEVECSLIGRCCGPFRQPVLRKRNEERV